MPPPVLFDRIDKRNVPVSGPMAWDAAWELLGYGPQTRNALVVAMMTCADITSAYAEKIVRLGLERGFLTEVSRDANGRPTYARAEL